MLNQIMAVMELKLVYNVTRLVINDELILPKNYTKFKDYKILKQITSQIFYAKPLEQYHNF